MFFCEAFLFLCFVLKYKSASGILEKTMKLRYFLYLIQLFFYLQIFAENESNTGTIYARADYWCPYNCATSEENPGFLVEILYQTFGKESVKYETMNWARAITETRSGTYDIIIGASKDDAPDFPLSVSVGKSKNCFYTTENKQFKYNGLKSIEKIKLGVAKDYSYYKELDDYITKNKSNENRINESFGDNVLEKFMLKLTNREIDAFVEDPIVVKYFFMKNQELTIQLKNSGCSKATDLYYAFAPNKKESTERILKLNKKIKEMIKTKEMDKLLKKYHIIKWYK